MKETNIHVGLKEIDFFKNDPMKYRLLRDCPCGKAGSEWRETEKPHLQGSRVMVYLEDENGYGFNFPQSTFFSWFEKIKEMKKFTRDQTRAINDHLYSRLDSQDFDLWLDKNTEK